MKIESTNIVYKPFVLDLTVGVPQGSIRDTLEKTATNIFHSIINYISVNGLTLNFHTTNSTENLVILERYMINEVKGTKFPGFDYIIN